MDESKVQEIQVAAFAYAQDVVQRQIAKGAPDHGMPKVRHIAVVADVALEMLASFGSPGGEDPKLDRQVLRAAFSGSLLNDSALRQELEGKGGRKVVLQKKTALSDEYDTE